MHTKADPFETFGASTLDVLKTPSNKPARGAGWNGYPRIALGRLEGFGLDDEPLVVGLPYSPNEVVSAWSTVRLTTDQVGSTAVIVCEDHEARRPIIVGVLDQSASPKPRLPVAPETDHSTSADRLEFRAEREVVIRCGEASITLTRAGKVIIQGKYVVSRSSGSNKIKGASVEIN
jgi:hypothetical protein